jgi:hypothetical protein
MRGAQPNLGQLSREVGWKRDVCATSATKKPARRSGPVLAKLKFESLEASLALPPECFIGIGAEAGRKLPKCASRCKS